MIIIPKEEIDMLTTVEQIRKEEENKIKEVK